MPHSKDVVVEGKHLAVVGLAMLLVLAYARGTSHWVIF